MKKLTPKKAEDALLAYGQTLPETAVEYPWEHPALKVRGKSFAFFGADAPLNLTVKLPVSAEMALTLPNVERAGYNLGKSGWVTARYFEKDDIDLDTLKDWIAQSYRAVAPKTLVKALDEKTDN